jgi:hypothetical protein
LAAHLERPEALQERLASGAVRTINAETVGAIFGRPGAEAATPRKVPPRTAPEVALSTKVPDYVLQQLRRRYGEGGPTIRNQILLALRLAGIEVRDDDLVDKRKHRS